MKWNEIKFCQSIQVQRAIAKAAVPAAIQLLGWAAITFLFCFMKEQNPSDAWLIFRRPSSINCKPQLQEIIKMRIISNIMDRLKIVE